MSVRPVVPVRVPRRPLSSPSLQPYDHCFGSDSVDDADAAAFEAYAEANTEANVKADSEANVKGLNINSSISISIMPQY